MKSKTYSQQYPVKLKREQTLQTWGSRQIKISLHLVVNEMRVQLAVNLKMLENEFLRHKILVIEKGVFHQNVVKNMKN